MGSEMCIRDSFDGDGLLDLAAVSTQNNDVSVLLGNGDGTFSNQRKFTTRNGFVTSGDFNGDGLADLALSGGLVSVLLSQCDTPSVTIVPDSFTVSRGFQIAGTLADALQSDDSRLRFNPGFIINDTEAPVWLIFDAALTSDSPAGLEIAFESQAGTPGLTATLEAFNWNSSSYDIVDASAASFNTDTVVSVDLSSGISNYVQSGAVRSRIGWRQTGFTINFPWEVRLDQMVWTVD